MMGTRSLALAANCLLLACGSASADRDPTPPGLNTPDTSVSGETGPGIDAAFDVPSSDVGALLSDPKTCEEANAGRTYIGCDYWPTVTPNPVWSIFDFAVVIANNSEEEANITVTGPNGFTKTVKVNGGSLSKVYLPWVRDLKGPDSGEGSEPNPNCTTIPMPAEQPSVTAKKGAYHLVSSRPVTVWQFNALEYKPAGGPPGKDWSSCPGNSYCVQTLGPAGCYSYSNDASLLLPTNALTGNYRITGQHSFTSPFGRPTSGAFVAITGTQDDTIVTVKTGQKTKILGGGDISSMGPSGTISFRMDKGDVQLIRIEPRTEFDPSGSLVQATKPVQVIAGVPCIYNPVTDPACDHIEETVFPAETLGKKYVIATPTAPDGKQVGHVVRLYGNVDGTTLTYYGSPPAGAPTTISAGDVIDLGIVKTDFVVEGSNELAVATFMLAGKLVDPEREDLEKRGDPSASLIAAAEQFRKKYIFLAPDDYDVNYAQITAAPGVKLELDGVQIDAPPTTVGSYVVHSVKLGAGIKGTHTLVASQPVGLQVMGYGKYTSYQYPGGLDLARIAPPPPK
jgi:hypothetical protein